jgi:16S rRNA (cytidine1402-2'-O)-methyltransferase
MADGRTTVLLEAPGRVAATLADLAAVDGTRRVAVVRELTKVHEEVWRGTAGDAAVAFAARQVRGEIVVVVGGAPPAGPVSDEAIDDVVRERLRRGPGEGPRQIALVVAEELGVPRRKVYEAVLRLRSAEEASPTP